MRFSRRLAVTTTIATMLGGLVLSGCSVGSIGATEAEGVTSITFTNFAEPDAIDYSNALIEGFEAENPDITVELDTVPSGPDGSNLLKSRLVSGDMSEVFAYNSGSLLQAMRPDEYLVALDDQPWVDDLTESYLPAVSTDQGIYGAPTGGIVPGGVVYNKRVYADLGLEVPTTWAEFEANNAAVAEDGRADPVELTFGDPWTSQLTLLADYANIEAAAPGWSERYDANQVHWSEEPAFTAWQHLQQFHDEGLLNEDFASATYDDGVRAVATGEAAHYPMLSGVIDAVEQNYPDNIDDIGMFAMPNAHGDDPQLTLFLPGGFFIPRSATGPELEAAKKFVAYTQSESGCQVLLDTGSDGPFVNSVCSVPEDTPQVVQDLQLYIDQNQAGPALEFLSPLAGPNLAQLAVEVGSGIRSAESGAELYDQDVEKQARQLGLDGW